VTGDSRKSVLKPAWLLLAIALPAAAGYLLATSWWTHDAASTGAHSHIVIGDGKSGPRDMVWVPGGQFQMGSDSRLTQQNEKPAHAARVKGFWMDRHHVTNAEFRRFVEATGYKTTAERKPEWDTIAPQVMPGTPNPPDVPLPAR